MIFLAVTTPMFVCIIGCVYFNNPFLIQLKNLILLFYGSTKEISHIFVAIDLVFCPFFISMS